MDHEWLRLTLALFELGAQLRLCVSAVLKEQFLPAVLAESNICANEFSAYAAATHVRVLDKYPTLPQSIQNALSAAKYKGIPVWKSNGAWWRVQKFNAPDSQPFYILMNKLKPGWTAEVMSQALKKATIAESPTSSWKEIKATVENEFEKEYGFYTIDERETTLMPSPMHKEYDNGDLLDRIWAEVVLKRHKNGPLSWLCPHWNNCDLSKWGSNKEDPEHLGVWEMAKAFLTKLGDRNYAITSKLSASDFSVDVLVNLMTYCHENAFEGRLDDNVLCYNSEGENVTILTRVNDIRKKRYGHIEDAKLSEVEAKLCITQLIEVLTMHGLALGLTSWNTISARNAAAVLEAIRDQNMQTYPQLLSLRVLAENEAAAVRAERDLALQQLKQKDTKLQQTDAKLKETEKKLRQTDDELIRTLQLMRQESARVWAEIKTDSRQATDLGLDACLDLSNSVSATDEPSAQRTAVKLVRLLDKRKMMYEAALKRVSELQDDIEILEQEKLEAIATRGSSHPISLT
jgi:hypothetical protein